MKVKAKQKLAKKVCRIIAPKKKCKAPKTSKSIPAIIPATVVPQPKADINAGLPPFTVHYDWQRRTCIVVSRTDTLVKFITMDSSEGLTVNTITPVLFQDQYKTHIPNYPIKKACQIYLDFGKLVGATRESLQFLKQVMPLTIEQENKIMSSKKTAAAAATATKDGSTKAPAVKKENASQMFQDLIMEGKLDDDAIFAKVKVKFGLDDNKRWYVAWYRNNLKRKKGIDCPPVITKASAAAAEKAAKAKAAEKAAKEKTKAAEKAAKEKAKLAEKAAKAKAKSAK